MRELKEVNACLGALSVTQVVIIVGNHDYLKSGSYYRTFAWEENIHVILDTQLSAVEFPELGAAVYGCSYDSRERTDRPYAGKEAPGRQPVEILMLHGGDDRHMPISRDEILELGYAYTALGHIHRPQELVPGRLAYSGAPEPVDKNDTGPHGYIKGEVDKSGSRITFVPSALREYRHITVEVDRKMTGYEVKEAVKREIEKQGTGHMYKVVMTGLRDPDIVFDLSGFDSYGNMVELTDNTRPAYDFAKLKAQNRENILGLFIGELEEAGKDTTEYRALCEGVRALMETRRG